MKFSDINENLTEGPLSGPAGFGKRVKAKAQKHLTPFNKVQQRVGTAKDKQYKEAKKIKQEFMVWKKMEGMSPKVYPTMQEFLEWIQGVDAKLGAAVEKVARKDPAYKKFFTTKIDDKGKETQTASDPKVKVRDNDPDAKTKVGGDNVDGDNLELEQELELADEEVEEEVDMSASIYESRLRAFLNEDGEDVAVQNSETLADNQIDTLIVKGIELRDKGGASVKKSDDDLQKAADGIANAKSKSDDEDEVEMSTASGGSAFDEYADDLEDILGTIANGKDLSDHHKKQAKIIWNELRFR